MDLIVWVDQLNRPIGFQFCYDKGRAERAITWSPQSGFTLMAVDDGDSLFGMGYKATPVLQPTSDIRANMAYGLFTTHCINIPAGIADFVQAKLASI